MQHHVEVTEVPPDDPAVPASLHLRGSCGWASRASDREAARAAIAAHEAQGDPAPTPAAPTPD